MSDGRARRLSTWTREYLREVALADLGCAVVGVFMAAQLRFGSNVTSMYLALSLALPVLWVAALWLAGAYDARFIGTGSDEFRKVLNAGVSLTAARRDLLLRHQPRAVPRVTWSSPCPASRRSTCWPGLPCASGCTGSACAGKCLHSVVAVGHELAVADLVTELGRDRYHGLTVVGACVVRPGECDEVVGVPVYGGLDDITAAVKAFDADTVAVTACPEMDGVRLRSLAWELEKTGTDLCVSPALLDVAGPRTTIRPTAGLTLLHVDHPQLAGFRLVLKGLFDRCAAAAALVMLAPVMAVLAAAVWLHDRGPALFTQVRVGKDGHAFRIYKFRTMVVDAEKRRAELLASNDSRRRAVQAAPGSPGNRGGSASAALVDGRAAAALQRVPRPHVAGGTAPGPARRGGEVRRARPPQAGGQAGPDRPVAGQRAIGSVLGGVGTARPAVRRELVVRARPADHVEDDLGARAGVGGLLMTLSDAGSTDRRPDDAATADIS